MAATILPFPAASKPAPAESSNAIAGAELATALYLVLGVIKALSPQQRQQVFAAVKHTTDLSPDAPASRAALYLAGALV